jgi:S-adenosylmethionine synthetase
MPLCHLHTSEPVSEGPSDKVCDRLSDAVPYQQDKAHIARKTFAAPNRAEMGGGAGLPDRARLRFPREVA